MATGITLFDRNRLGVNEDRRTEALFLSLNRSQTLARCFVKDVLGVDPADDSIEITAWPEGYGSSKPDGQIVIRGRLFAIFEAKVKGNPLEREQVERYARRTAALCSKYKVPEGKEHRIFVPYLFESTSKEVGETCERHGLEIKELSHHSLLHHLHAWASTEDIEARFIANELATYLSKETNMTRPESLTPEQLSDFAQHFRAIDRVREQLRYRRDQVADLMALSSPKPRRGVGLGEEWLEVEVEGTGTRLTAGMTFSLVPTPQCSIWFSLDVAGLDQVEVAASEVVKRAKEHGELGEHSSIEQDGELSWYYPLPFDDMMSPLRFAAVKQGLVEQIQQEMALARRLWPKIAVRCAELNLLPTLPVGMQKRLLAWVNDEVEKGYLLRVSADRIESSLRRHEGGFVHIAWKGESYQEGKLTVWADKATPRSIRDLGWSRPDENDERFIIVSTIQQLEDVLESI